MAGGYYIDSDAGKLLRRFHRLPKEMQGGIKDGLLRGLLIVEDRVWANAELKSRRGAAGLRGRLTSYAQVLQGIALDGVIGFRKTRGFPYELAHEDGAQAKPGKAMAVPVSPKAKRLSMRGVSPRDFGKPLFIPPGTHVLAEHHGLKGFQSGKGIMTVHYVLLKSLPPRLHFRETVVDSMGIISAEVVKGVGRLR